MGVNQLINWVIGYVRLRVFRRIRLQGKSFLIDFGIVVFKRMYLKYIMDNLKIRQGREYVIVRFLKSLMLDVIRNIYM